MYLIKNNRSCMKKITATLGSTLLETVKTDDPHSASIFGSLSDSDCYLF